MAELLVHCFVPRFTRTHRAARPLAAPRAPFDARHGGSRSKGAFRCESRDDTSPFHDPPHRGEATRAVLGRGVGACVRTCRPDMPCRPVCRVPGRRRLPLRAALCDARRLQRLRCLHFLRSQRCSWHAPQRSRRLRLCVVGVQPSATVRAAVPHRSTMCRLDRRTRGMRESVHGRHGLPERLLCNAAGRLARLRAECWLLPGSLRAFMQRHRGMRAHRPCRVRRALRAGRRLLGGLLCRTPGWRKWRVCRQPLVLPAAESGAVHGATVHARLV